MSIDKRNNCFIDNQLVVETSAMTNKIKSVAKNQTDWYLVRVIDYEISRIKKYTQPSKLDLDQIIQKNIYARESLEKFYYLY